MASPHTAGAAALLAQQHPGWSAAELKSALMSSAKPHPDQDVFDQGAGRVDLARAIKQTVVPRPGSLSFGIARWPHNDDEPVVKQLTYRNFGDSDVTLALQGMLVEPNGEPAPAGALSLSASTITVPAGGTAAVTVTSNTRHDGPDGAYSGRITATAGEVVSPALVFDLPSRATHFVEAGAVTWQSELAEFVRDEWGFPVEQTDLFSKARNYQAGKEYAERWNAAVFGPVFSPAAESAFARAHRVGDRIDVDLPMYSDQNGHQGFSLTDTASTKLYRDGVLIGESDADAKVWVENVPGARGDFRLVSTATRRTISGLSTRTDAVWTFSSQTASEDGEMLPLWAVRYLPAVDSRNTVERRPVSVLPVKLEVQSGATVGELRTVEIMVSGDDGTSWSRATVRRIGDNRYAAVFVTPTGASHVSLKAKAVDSAGNASEQTVIRAYALR